MSAAEEHDSSVVEPLRIDAVDDDVWALTLRALAASSKVRPPVKIVCRQCQGVIARAGHTPHGPLFTSTWPTPPGDTARLLRQLARRRAFAAVLAPRSAAENRDGTIALLALPPGYVQEFPDLLVRCPDHGDAVIARSEVLARLRDTANKSPMKVRTSYPRRTYHACRIE